LKKALIRTSLLFLGCAALLLSPTLPEALGTMASSPPSDAQQMKVDPEAERLLQGRAAEETSGPAPEEHLRLMERAEKPSSRVTALGLSVQASAEPKPAPAPGSGSGSGSSPDPTPGQGSDSGTTEDQEDINVSVRGWVAALAKEKGFEGWADSRWDIYPLGPGTHSWVVILRSKQQEVGYLVVAASENGGYKLLEYGTGTNPLFSMETLYRSSVQLGLIPDSSSYEAFVRGLASDSPRVKRLYAPPLQAAWEITMKEGRLFLDAKTGEELPDLVDWADGLPALPLAGKEPASPAVNRQVAAAEQWESFDPFEKAVWVKGKPLRSEDFPEWLLTAGKSGSKLTYSAKWFGGKVLYPLAVTGYHSWKGGSSFISLEQEGSRFIPYDTATQFGGYYPLVSPPFS